MDTTTIALVQQRCIPMVKTVKAEQAEDLIRVLRESGMRIANISQHMSDGLPLLRRLAKEKDLIVGGGNVQTKEEAEKAIKAGAAFIFSPLFDEQIVRLCQDASIPIFAVTTQAFVAKTWNLDVLGCFPVEELGGLPFIDEMGEKASLSFIVAGHITEAMTPTYLENPHVLAMTGSWMIDGNEIQNNNWQTTLEALKRAKKFSLPL